jgi:shikimate dehydrogenase
MKYLDEVDTAAREIGAVNVISFRNGKLKGYNTDSAAFFETLERWLPKDKSFNALVLGTGGSSKAVQQALRRLKRVEYKTVSREAGKGDLTYEQVNADKKIIGKANLIINTTPLGMHPNTEAMAPIRFENIGSEHYVYDLIYNPARTVLLQKAEMHGATIKNGLEMLHVQAEKSWDIWNN